MLLHINITTLCHINILIYIYYIYIYVYDICINEINTMLYHVIDIDYSNYRTLCHHLDPVDHRWGAVDPPRRCSRWRSSGRPPWSNSCLHWEHGTGLERFQPTNHGWWFGTWNLFSPIVGMMLQSQAGDRLLWLFFSCESIERMANVFRESWFYDFNQWFSNLDCLIPGGLWIDFTFKASDTLIFCESWPCLAWNNWSLHCNQCWVS